MIHFLSRILIKDRENYQDAQVRSAYGRLCGWVGIMLNVLLFGIKFIAGTLSKSIAITADAFNNLSDAGSSIITLLGFKMASAKPDPEHPFGHGRLEYISGLIVSGIIIVMGVELFRDSVDKIIHPQETAFSTVVMVILLISIATKLYMAYYNYSIAKKIDSTAMKATGADSLSDTLATTIVLISMLISHYFGYKIDGICGLIVAVIILYAGYSAGKETIAPLLGQPPEPEFVNHIEEIVLGQEGIVGVHDLVVHDYGPGRVMISLHAEVPADVDILKSHDIIDVTEQLLKKELNCNAIIHMDPVIVNDPRVTELKEQVVHVVRQWHHEATMHDFRVVFGDTHTNLLFDVVAPYSVEEENKEIQKQIQELIWKEIGETFFAVIEVDRSYI